MPITYSCKHVNREKGIHYGGAAAAAAAAEYIRVSVNLRSVATIQVNGPAKYLNEQKRKKPLLRKSIVGDGDASWKTPSPLDRARDEKFRIFLIYVVPEARPVHVVLVHARVARFDGLLYAITLPGSQSASLSVRFKMGGQSSTP